MLHGLKRDSPFHKVDDLTVPDNDVRSEICGCDVLRKAVVHPGQVCSDVHPYRQESAGKVRDGNHCALHCSDAEKEPSGKHSEHGPETGAPRRVDTSMRTASFI